MRLNRMGAVTISVLVGASSGCHSSVTRPSATGPPRLEANATALVNLIAIETLERSTGRPTRLVAVSGLVDRRGRLPGEGTWYYTFRDPADVPGAVYQWRVDAAGVVTQEHLGSCGFGERPTGRLAVDSDQAVATVLQTGGETVLRQHDVSQPTFGITYAETTVRVRLYVPNCYIAFADIDAASGTLIEANFSCAGPITHPCIGPGVYRY